MFNYNGEMVTPTKVIQYSPREVQQQIGLGYCEIYCCVDAGRPYQHIHPGMSRGNRDESPQGLIISLRNATCLPQLEGAVACVLRWVGGGREQGSVRVFGAGDLDQEGSISLTLTCDIDRPSDL